MNAQTVPRFVRTLAGSAVRASALVNHWRARTRSDAPAGAPSRRHRMGAWERAASLKAQAALAALEGREQA